MLTNEYFTSYYPVNSQIHKLNPVIKLLCFILFLVPIIASTDMKLEVFMAFIVLVLMYYSRVPLRFYFNTIYGLRYVYVVLVLLLAFKGLYLDEALLILIKIVSTMLYLSMIFYTTSPSELKYGLEKLLTPFNLFSINISPLINKIVSLITFFPILFTTEREVLLNASSRGLDYFHADILSKILAVISSFKNTLRLTFEKLEKIKFVSALMGYSTKKYRTNLRTNKVGFNDLLLLLVHLSFIAYYVWEKNLYAIFG